MGNLVIGKMKTAHDPLPDWDWAWVTLGSPKGHARVTQASRKGRPSVDFLFGLCFQQELEKRPGGWEAG
jgi:hypothetical protein